MNKFNATDFLEKYNNLLAEEFKDVEFAGLLCVKEKSNGNGYTYFNIDLAGNAISRFKVKEDCLNFNVFKDDKIVEVVQNSQSKILTKPNVVEVIRYFRIWDFELGQIASSGGMTAICLLDYDAKIMTVYPSFCEDSDNFDKLVGLNLAKQQRILNRGFVLPFIKSRSINLNMVEAYNLDTIRWLGSCSEERLSRALDRFMSK